MYHQNYRAYATRLYLRVLYDVAADTFYLYVYSFSAYR